MTGLTSKVPFFYGRVTSLQNRLNQPSADFCQTILCFALYGASRELLAEDRRLYPPTSVLKTKDSFPNFLWRKGIIFALKCLANHLALSSSTISSGHATRVTYIALLCPTDYRSWSAGSFGLLIQTLWGRGIDLPFPLSHIPRHTVQWVGVSICQCQFTVVIRSGALTRTGSVRLVGTEDLRPWKVVCSGLPVQYSAHSWPRSKRSYVSV